jgi:hypothetical protein
MWFNDIRKRSGDSPKDRQNAIIFPLRTLFAKHGWGWNPIVLSTLETYTLESQRTERGLQLRDEYFPVYLKYMKYLTAPPPPVNKNEVKEDGPTRMRKVEAIFAAAAKQLQTLKLGEFSESHARTLMCFGHDAPDKLHEYFVRVFQTSTAMQSLSGMKLGEEGARLQSAGWKQYKPYPNIWLPPCELTNKICNFAAPSGPLRRSDPPEPVPPPKVLAPAPSGPETTPLGNVLRTVMAGVPAK